MWQDMECGRVGKGGGGRGREGEEVPIANNEVVTKIPDMT